MNKRFNILSVLLLLATVSWSQEYNHEYKRELSGVKNQWHKIIIPDAVFAKTKPDFTDIRILGIKDNDTTEAPYIVREVIDGVKDKVIDLKIINQSHNSKGYYYTLEADKSLPVNRIQLDFSQQNFDWKVKLDASFDQEEWFTLKENYRIISIHNNWTNYEFSKIIFSESKYSYFRIFIETTKDPQLLTASLSKWESVDVEYNNYEIISFTTKENKKNKETIVDVKLKYEVPVDYLKVSIKDKIDFYREVKIQGLQDSVKTDKGYHYNFKSLGRGTFSSFEENEFTLSGRRTQQLRLIIENNDNEPLNVSGITVKGKCHEIVARLNPEMSYGLYYSDDNLRKPRYEISHLQDVIPDSLTALQIGNEEILVQKVQAVEEGLFKNPLWLWVIMGVIILLLGWFSLKMIKGNN